MTPVAESLIDQYWPERGPCVCCGGPDARHRIFDAIHSRYLAQEDIGCLATDYAVSRSAIVAVIQHMQLEKLEKLPLLKPVERNGEIFLENNRESFKITRTPPFEEMSAEERKKIIEEGVRFIMGPDYEE